MRRFKRNRLISNRRPPQQAWRKNDAWEASLRACIRTRAGRPAFILGMVARDIFDSTKSHRMTVQTASKKLVIRILPDETAVSLFKRRNPSSILPIAVTRDLSDDQIRHAVYSAIEQAL